jgi:hypothetical protein
MPQYLTKTFALIFAFGAVLIGGNAFAATTAEPTVALKANARSAAPAKPSRPIQLFLTDTVIRASQKPFSRYQSEKPFGVVNNQETERSAASPSLTLFPSLETRPMSSLMIGWIPAKDGTNTAGPYQSRPYQYASTTTDVDCPTMDRTAGNAVETSDSSGKGLRPPAGWMLGMCLHY